MTESHILNYCCLFLVYKAVSYIAIIILIKPYVFSYYRESFKRATFDENLLVLCVKRIFFVTIIRLLLTY